MNIYDFYNKVLEFKNTNLINCQNIISVDITEDCLSNIKKCIEIRNFINTNIKQLGNYAKYRRNEEVENDIDLKSMIGEYALNKKILDLTVKSRNYNFITQGPAIAEILLNKEEPDFKIKYKKSEEDAIYFDVKSNWADANFVTINEDSHNRYKEINNFYMICLIEKNEQQINKANYIAMPVKFLDSHKLQSGFNGTKYYKIAVEKILNSIIKDKVEVKKDLGDILKRVIS